MNSPIAVEPATLADLPRLVELLSTGPSEVSTLASGIRSALEQPGLATIFVVRQNGRILATATFQITVSTAEGGWVSMLSHFVVDAAYRHQGMGSMLLETIHRHAVTKGISRITLMPDGVSPDARCFFAKHGFAGSGMIAMHRSLSTS